MASKKRTTGHQNGRRWKTSSILLAVGIGALAALVAVGGILAFTGGDDTPRRSVRQTPVVSDAAEVTVEVFDNDYEPRHLTINQGATVTWKFTGDLPHTVTHDEDAFDSGTLGRGDEYALTFEDPGEYAYYCTLHHAMQGTIVVAP
ncbi:MAG: plastocyanin/azurin family copper-binding protein [Dehalococcoidia bacterium]